MDIRFYYSFLCVYLYHPWKSILYTFILFFVIPLYVNCVSVILNCTYVMCTRPCIIMIVLLQFHCGFGLLSPFLCCMLSILCTMTYPVALVKIDVMISPLRILFFLKYPTPCRRCFVVLMLLLLLSLLFRVV